MARDKAISIRISFADISRALHAVEFISILSLEKSKRLA